MFDELIKAHGDEVRDGKNSFGIACFDVITPDGSYSVTADYNLDGTPNKVVVSKKWFGIF